MSRNFQLKFWLNIIPKGLPQDPIIFYVRIYIVWPRQFSRTNAIGALTNANFPLIGMVDQDNWIIWKDQSYTVSTSPGSTMALQSRYITFNKRFFCSLEYPTGTENLATKTPWMIIVHNVNVDNYDLRVQGYQKMSYKDT